MSNWLERIEIIWFFSFKALEVFNCSKYAKHLVHLILKSKQEHFALYFDLIVSTSLYYSTSR